MISTDTVEVEVQGLSKRFRDHGRLVNALEDVNLEIQRGEFVSIVGSSGCGKTTLLRILAGLELDYDGHVSLDGAEILGPGLDKGVVFQDHRLLPWLTVEDNVGFGLKSGATQDGRKVVQHYIDLVGLRGFEKAYPAQLSGGMAQRAAIARSLVNRPKILLLDEPLGALDALTRVHMHRELEKIWSQEKVTMVMVTHDVDEAVYLSDRVVILSSRPGRIKKVIPVNLARPRDRSLPAFQALKSDILQEFQLGAKSPFAYEI